MDCPPYISLSYRPSRVAKQCILPLTGSAVPFKLLQKKDKDLICPRHSIYHIGTDFAYDFALIYAGKIACKYIFEAVLFIAHGAEYIFVQDVGYEVCLHSPRIDYLFVIFAYVFEHVFYAVGNFMDVVYGVKIAPSELIIEKAVLYALLPPVPLGVVIFMLFQHAGHLFVRYVGKGVEVQSLSLFPAFPSTYVSPVPPRREVVENVHQFLSETFLRVLFGIIGERAKIIPAVVVPSSYHPFVPLPAVAAQPVEVLFHKLRCFVLVLEHGSKLL